jgi:hypothetical protein
MGSTQFKWISALVVILNIIGFVMVALFIPPNGFNNFLILGLLALGQSFLNTVFAGICIMGRYLIEKVEMKENLTVLIKGFWIATGLSVILAIIYCFIAVPVSQGKPVPLHTPKKTESGLGY